MFRTKFLTISCIVINIIVIAMMLGPSAVLIKQVSYLVNSKKWFLTKALVVDTKSTNFIGQSLPTVNSPTYRLKRYQSTFLTLVYAYAEKNYETQISTIECLDTCGVVEDEPNHDVIQIAVNIEDPEKVILQPLEISFKGIMTTAQTWIIFVSGLFVALSFFNAVAAFKSRQSDDDAPSMTP